MVAEYDEELLVRWLDCEWDEAAAETEVDLEEIYLLFHNGSSVSTIAWFSLINLEMRCSRNWAFGSDSRRCCCCCCWGEDDDIDEFESDLAVEVEEEEPLLVLLLSLLLGELTVVLIMEDDDDELNVGPWHDEGFDVVVVFDVADFVDVPLPLSPSPSLEHPVPPPSVPLLDLVTVVVGLDNDDVDMTDEAAAVVAIMADVRSNTNEYYWLKKEMPANPGSCIRHR